MKPVVSIANLDFSWPGSDEFHLKIDDFSLSAGQRLCVFGPSGSGKSTLLNLITGVMAYQANTIFVCGQDLGSLKAYERDRMRADHIGVVFQQFNLLPALNVLDNVLLPCKISPARRQRVQDPNAEAMRLLNELGVGIYAAKPIDHLSIGQQQRVALARALIGMPELLVADEPTSALDPETAQRFMDLLESECDRLGTALIIVSHDTSIRDRCPLWLSLGGDQHGIIQLQQVESVTP